MCWSVPGKIINIKGKTAEVEVSGIVKNISLDLLKEASRGDYVLVHAGYAIQKVDEADAKFTIEFFNNKGKNV
ncbi:MAG: HypC/HybG/HupF family hydrogenase formation chaperone [Candidatus Omnitrophica bacterium]|nr:HypC/HybG/HupF family hydrogenase formation chaperone [Candidatus Omnitrophota bacterium]